MKIHPSNRKLSAYHEAGHAVIAIVSGIPVESVSMEDGETRYLEDADILTCLAGVFAAQHIDKIGITGADDLFKAKKMLKEGENLEDYERKAKDLVLRHKKSITAVAKALLEKNTLLGEEVKELVDMK